MRQVLPVQHTNQADFAADQLVSIYNNLSQSLANKHLVEAPWPGPATLKSLTILEPFDNVVWTFYVNDSPSALTATSIANTLVTVLADVDLVEGDIVYYRRTGDGWRPQTHGIINTILEWDTPDNFTSYYMVPASFQFSGGLLGANGAGGTPPGSTISVAPFDGTVEKLVALANFGIIDANQGLRWTCYKTPVGTLIPIAQDGSGGTPDTVITIMDTQLGRVLATKSFTLPFAPSDRLECWMQGVNPTGLNHVNAFGVVVRSTIAHQFAIVGSNPVGGQNFASPQAYGSFPGTWMLGNNPGGITNQNAINYFGPTTVYLTGLQVGAPFLGSSLWAGDSLTLALVVDGGDPANQPTVTLTAGNSYAVDSDPTHVVAMTAGAYMATRGTIANTQASQAHWSFLAYTVPPPIPLPAGCPNGLPLPTVAGPAGCAAGV